MVTASLFCLAEAVIDTSCMGEGALPIWITPWFPRSSPGWRPVINDQGRVLADVNPPFGRFPEFPHARASLRILL